MKRWSVATLGLILTILLVILVWNKEPSVYPYVSAAIVLSALLAFSIISYHNGTGDKLSTIFLIFLVFLFLRNVQFIATHYGALTPDDVTWEYAVINSFLDEGKIFVIPGQAMPQIILTWYSAWPLLHSFSVIFSNVLNVSPQTLPLVLPSIFSLVGFLFLYLVLNKLTTALKLSGTIIPLALLIYAISPEAIYYGWKFARQGLGITLVLIQFYLLYKYIPTRDLRLLALISLNSLVIVLAHHYTSFIFTGYLLALAGLIFISALAVGRVIKCGRIADLSKFRKQAVVLIVVGLLSAASVFVWWNQVGTIIHGKASAVTIRVMEMGGPSLEPALPGIESSIPGIHYPHELTPPWVNLLWARDFLIYVPVFVGFIWLLRRNLRKRSLNYKELAGLLFLALSLIIFGAFFLFEFFVSHVETYRIIALSLPLIVFGSAIVYVKALSNRNWLKWLTSIVLVFVTTSSLLGLWGHRYAPIHLYCSAVSAHDVGEAVPLDDRHYALQRFVTERELDCKSEKITSDDNNLLYQLLAPQQYDKIGSMMECLSAEADAFATDTKCLLVIDFGASSYRHYWGSRARFGPEAAEERRTQYRTELEANLDKVYDSGLEIWLR